MVVLVQALTSLYCWLARVQLSNQIPVVRLNGTKKVDGENVPKCQKVSQPLGAGGDTFSQLRKFTLTKIFYYDIKGWDKKATSSAHSVAYGKIVYHLKQ